MTVSAERTIKLSSGMLAWPIAEVNASLDYTGDASAEMEDGGDTLISATLQIAPSGAGELVALNLNVTDALITTTLTGGVAGRTYFVEILAKTSTGRAFDWLINLVIDDRRASDPLPPAPDLGFGPTLSWGSSGGARVLLLF